MFGSFAKKLTDGVAQVKKDVSQQVQQVQTRAETATESVAAPFNAPEVMLSDCKGLHRALFIGINYFGQKGELRGCINDVKNVSSFVMQNFGFKAENCRFLTDDLKDATSIPNRANIIAGMKWLVAGAKKGDSLFIHYSGHGGTEKNSKSGEQQDEEGGVDETICPVDYASAGQIVDDEIHDLLVKPLGEGVRLTAIFDSCHSGTVMDLPYLYKLDGKLDVVNEVDIRTMVMQALAEATQQLMKGDHQRAIGGIMSMARGVASRKMGAEGRTNALQDRLERLKATNADVIQFSGCRDEQTSADASIGGSATGALSWALMETFKRHGKDVPYGDLLKHVRDLLQEGKYSQVPQMTSGCKMNVKQKFFM